MFNHLNRERSAPRTIRIIAVLALVVGGGVLAYQHYYMAEKEQPDIPTPTTEVSTMLLKAKLTPEELAQRLSECKNIQDYSDQVACYGNLAIDANDPNLCPELGSALCRYFVFMWHTDLCSDIPIKKPIFGFDKDQATLRDLDNKKECLKKIAIETKNAELCENLFDEAADCQNTVALELNDPSKCSDFPGDCVMKIAIKNKDITLCESKYDKAWCLVQFSKLLPESKAYDQSCYKPPLDIEASGAYEIKNKYRYPNAYDSGLNDYPTEIAPKSHFYHLLSIPFNNSNSLLRVYSNSNRDIALLRLIKYSRSSETSELLGDIRSETGSNWSGIYIPIAISKDDNHIIFEAHMGAPGAGGGSVTMGYAYLSLVSAQFASAQYDDCGYLNPKKIANQAYFYDNFSKALFYSEEKNVPPSEQPGPYYNSAIKFINIITAETKTLLEEPNTIYEIINIDEESGVVNFKSCPWQKYRFSCPVSDGSTQIRFINLP